MWMSAKQERQNTHHQISCIGSAEICAIRRNNMLIKISGKNSLGKSRSEFEANLHKEWGSAALTHEQIDKCRFVEKHTGAKFVDSRIIDAVK
jgi:hypothetical protein